MILKVIILKTTKSRSMKLNCLGTSLVYFETDSISQSQKPKEKPNMCTACYMACSNFLCHFTTMYNSRLL